MDPSPNANAAAPPAGWLLVADQRVLDIDPMLRRFGQVYRYPISASGAEPAPGAPCFLLRTDRSKVIGLWAIGEVVAPCLSIDPSVEHPAAGRAGDLDADGGQRYAEVELLPLQKPIAMAKLTAEGPLAEGTLERAAQADPRTEGPVALSTREVRAIEALDFWIEEPTDEQRRALDDLLAREEQELGIG